MGNSQGIEMRIVKIMVLILVVNGLSLSMNTAIGQQEPGRVEYQGQQVFLNGGNIAWIDFGSDIGPGKTRLDDFEKMFRQVSDHGGNAMRFWMHITGEHTPEWEGNKVTGPGKGTIRDMRQILDLAEEYGVGMKLCLWSFDMLRRSNGPEVTDRAKALLTDSVLTQTYIDNALVPMVDSLAGHPAIIAWEIFNEPEGMSQEFGWEFNRHVPMSAIQRFVNMTAGAIHRAAPEAQVTNGTWSFHALWEGSGHEHADNYYSDSALIEAGGDPLGTLDFYSVHYYDWAGKKLSPFHHDASHWGLDKPIVVGEFGVPEDELFGIPADSLYHKLYEGGYAGALVWQWIDWYADRGDHGKSWLRGLELMEELSQKHPEAMDFGN